MTIPATADGADAPRVTVALDVGQLRRPVPGGVGRYVEGLLGALPAAGAAVERFDGGRLGDLAWHRLRWPPVRAAGDVVHATSLAVPPAGRRPLVVTVHDLAFREAPEATTPRGRRFHEAGLARARATAAVVITPSTHVREQLIGTGFDPDRVTAVHHGVDVAPVVAPAPVGGAPYVLAVGTVEPRKRFDVVAAAVGDARAAVGDLDLVVVGPPGWGDVVLPDAPWCRRAGMVTEAELDGLYRGAVALVQASAHEGFGFPLVEAMARGCPVVAVAGASAPEVVGDAGLLVAPGDPDALAAAVARVATDATLAADLAARGRARAAGFTWAASAAAHVAVYHRALAHP